MECTDYYITLPSNANMDVYPDNRPGSFKVDLSHRHELHDGVWEIGLSEIQFTNSWLHRTPAFDLVAWVAVQDAAAAPVGTSLYKSRHPSYVMSDAEKRYLDVTGLNIDFPRFVTVYVNVPEREWQSEHCLGDELAERIRYALNISLRLNRMPQIQSLRYERNNAAATVQFKCDASKIIGFTTEHTDVMRMLGLTPTSGSIILEDRGSKVKAYMFDEGVYRLQGGFPSLEVMFVYSSVCEEQHIGDQAGNLLKAVPVTVEHGKRQCERYSPATYVRLRPSTLDSIDIQLLDKTGAEVSFSDGSSVVVMLLHVRKRRPPGWY